MSIPTPPGYVKPLQRKKKVTEKNAKKKMHKRNFDPIDALVDNYERLLKEDEYWCAIRDGSMEAYIKKHNRSLKAVRYSAVTHAAILAQISKIGESLLRYGYGRVPENEPEEKAVLAPFIVNLDDGDFHEINGD